MTLCLNYLRTQNNHTQLLDSFSEFLFCVSAHNNLYFITQFFPLQKLITRFFLIQVLLFRDEAFHLNESMGMLDKILYYILSTAKSDETLFLG